MSFPYAVGEEPVHDKFICQHCNSDEGYFVKLTVSNTYHYTGSGNPNGTGDAYYTKGGNRYYCSTCERVVTKDVKRLMDKNSIDPK